LAREKDIFFHCKFQLETPHVVVEPFEYLEYKTTTLTRKREPLWVRNKNIKLKKKGRDQQSINHWTTITWRTRTPRDAISFYIMRRKTIVLASRPALSKKGKICRLNFCQFVFTNRESILFMIINLILHTILVVVIPVHPSLFPGKVNPTVLVRLNSFPVLLRHNLSLIITPMLINNILHVDNG
jgi:hypothetical protein